MVEDGTVRPSERKVTAVLRSPKPTSTKAVQCFLDLTGYFRKFISHYALIARPLSNLLKNGVKFVFGTEQERAFGQLKEILMKDPVLKLYRAGAWKFIPMLHNGLGAILLQKNAADGSWHSVYFANWKTVGAEGRYTSYESEVLTVVKALRKFRIYLLDIPHSKL